jgi:lipoprotein Spr
MHYLFITLCFLLSLFLSCAVNASSFYINVERTPSHTNVKEEDIRKKILSQYSHWQGVKYQFGGTTKKGIDCSSLMQQIFHAAFPDTLRTRLARTTAEQIKQGSQAFPVKLMPGDLLFFQMSPDERHVGVYIGNEQFVHASTSKGVMISDLKKDYWKIRFKTARRVIS